MVPKMTKVKEPTGISIIKTERKRQQEKYNPEHDDIHNNHELALIAALYATPKILLEQDNDWEDIRFKDPWPVSWAVYHDKRPIISSSGRLNTNPADIMKTERIKNLAIAGALIAAEIDRLIRVQENDHAK